MYHCKNTDFSKIKLILSVNLKAFTELVHSYWLQANDCEMKYLVRLIPLLLVFGCAPKQKQYEVTLNTVSAYIHVGHPAVVACFEEVDTILAANDSAAYVLGYIKLQIAKRRTEAEQKRRPTSNHQVSVKLQIHDLKGKVVKSSLSSAAINRIDDSVARIPMPN